MSLDGSNLMLRDRNLIYDFSLTNIIVRGKYVHFLILKLKA
jgi:hypothetical protein